MLTVGLIAAYALTLLLVTFVVARISGRPLVPVANAQQPDGSYDHLPSVTVLVFAFVALGIAWTANFYSPPLSALDLFALAITNTGWAMLAFLLLLRKNKYRVIGFEGRREIIFATAGFLVVGIVLTNWAVL